MKSLASLALLNDLDLAIDGLRARLAEIAEGLKEPSEVRTARAEFAQIEGRLADLQVVQREREEAQADATQKVAAEEASLYSGRVTGPKELKDKQANLAQLRRQRDQRENELLEVLIEVESATSECNDRRERLAELLEQWRAKRAALLGEQEKLAKRLAAQAPRQASARAAAPQDLLPLYDRLRVRRAGRAVAALENDTCSACRVAVPPTKIEAARYSEDLVYCENCGRLLWAE
jgi:predicted  nucleic acid-binding Zn-ribbon protein